MAIGIPCNLNEFAELLKADRPHPHYYPHMPTDYRDTDEHFELVMTLLCSKLQPGETQTHGRAEATNSIISLLR